MLSLYPRLRFKALLKKGLCGNNALCLLRDLFTWTDWLIDEAMFDFLRLFTGDKPLREILRELRKSYPREQPKQLLSQCVNTLQMLCHKGVCELAHIPAPAELRIFDQSFEYPLENLSIAITSRCNFSCKYCYVERKDPTELALDVYRRLLDEAVYDMGVIRVGITGGEPLLVESLAERVTYAAKRGCEVTLLTNGFLLTPEWLDRLVDAGLRRVAISFDTDSPEVFESLTGVSGSYETVLHNISYALSQNAPVLIGIVLIKGVNDSKQSLQQVVSRFTDLGVNQISYTPVFPFGAASQLTDFVVEPPAVAELSLCFSDVDTSPDAWKLPKEANIFEEKHDFVSYKDLSLGKTCDLGKGTLHVQPDGRITPCPSLPCLVLGCLGKDKLRTVWTRSEVLRELREYDARVAPECSECKAVPWCNGGCRARAYYDTGSLRGPDRWACGMYQGCHTC